MELLEFITKNRQDNLLKAQDLHKQGFYTKAIAYYFRVLNASEIINDREGEAEAKKGIMFCYAFKCDYDQVLDYSNDLLASYQLESEQRELCMTAKAFALNRKGQFRSAESILKDLLFSDSQRVKFRAHTDLGLLYYFLHRFSENHSLELAFENFQAAHQLAPAVSEHAIYKSSSNMGLTYLEKSELELALKSFEQSLSYIKNDHQKAQTFNELGRVYALLGELEKSEGFFEKAARYALENSKFVTLTYNLYYRGLIQIHLGRVNNAYNYLHTALYSFLEHKHYPEVVVIYKELSNLFREDNPQRAEYFLKEYQYYLNYIDPLGEE